MYIIEVRDLFFVKAIDPFHFIRIKFYLKILPQLHKNMKNLKSIKQLSFTQLLHKFWTLLKFYHLIFFKRRIKKLSYKINTFKLNFEAFMGFSWQYFQDSLFMGTIILLLVKTLYRLILQENPFWQLNLVIYITSTLLAIKFDLLPPLREKVVEIIKKNIGRVFWYPNVNDCIAEMEIAENERIRSSFNFGVEYFLTCLIWVRLVAFQEPVLFLFFKVILIYLLIFNKYLILASLVSFISILARLVIYMSEFSQKEFFDKLKIFEYLGDNETYAPTWRNANIILLWVTRTFEYRKHFIETHTPIVDPLDDAYSFAFMHRLNEHYHFLLPPYFVYNIDEETGQFYIIEYNSKSAKDNVAYFPTYQSRVWYSNEFKDYYCLQPVISKVRKNSLLWGVVAIMVITYGMRNFAQIEMFELTQNNMLGGKMFRIFSEKVTGKVAKNNPELRSIMSGQDTSGINHMVAAKIQKNPYTDKIELSGGNYTTLEKKKESIGLFGITHNMNTSYGMTQVVHTKPITPGQFSFLKESLEKRGIIPCEKGVDIAHDYVGYSMSIERKNKLKNINPEFERFFEISLRKSSLNEVDLSLIKLEAVFSDQSSYRQTLEALDQGQRYHENKANELAINIDGIKNSQLHNNIETQIIVIENMKKDRKLHLERAKACKNIKNIIIDNENKIEFADKDDPEIEKKIVLFDAYNEKVEENKNIPQVEATRKLLQDIHDIPAERVDAHYTHSYKEEWKILSKKLFRSEYPNKISLYTHEKNYGNKHTREQYETNNKQMNILPVKEDAD